MFVYNQNTGKGVGKILYQGIDYIQVLDSQIDHKTIKQIDARVYPMCRKCSKSGFPAYCSAELWKGRVGNPLQCFCCYLRIMNL